jgi:putative addiction module killer protein
MYRIIHYLDGNENDIFQAWLDSLRDRTAKIAIIRRVARLELGQFGDHKALRMAPMNYELMWVPGTAFITHM